MSVGDLGPLFVAVAVGVIAPRLAAAEEAESPNPTEQQDLRAVLGTRLLGRESGGGIELDARMRLLCGVQLGAAFGLMGYERAYVSGQTVLGAGGLSGTAIFVAPVVTAHPVELDLRLESGVLAIDDFGQDVTALRQTDELGMFAHVHIGDLWLLRAGAIVGVEMEVDPTVDLADQTQLITLGVGYAISDHLLAYVDATGGGTFGFNGDNGKFVFEGSFGLRVPFGAGGARVAF
jgi:hypothetical protein